MRFADLNVDDFEVEEKEKFTKDLEDDVETESIKIEEMYD